MYVTFSSCTITSHWLHIWLLASIIDVAVMMPSSGYKHRRKVFTEVKLESNCSKDFYRTANPLVTTGIAIMWP